MVARRRRSKLRPKSAAFRSRQARPSRRVWQKIGLAAVVLIVAVAAFGYYVIYKSMAELPTEGAIAGRVTATTGLIPYSMPGIAGVTVAAETLDRRLDAEDAPGTLDAAGQAEGPVSSPGRYTAKTNGQGVFSLDVPPGVYVVTFEKRGFETYNERVIAMPSGQTPVFISLFREPRGKAVARLKGPKASKGPVPYHTSVKIDATGSKNVSRYGVRWEVRDGTGSVLMDPYASTAEPLQLEPSPIPGSAALDYRFVPLEPGEYTVTVFMRNQLSDEESSASATFVAANTAPTAIANVMAGPGRPAKTPSGAPKQSSGLATVVVGAPVFLEGWGVDVNAPSLETYNPGGRAADAYGKNDDWDQRQFAWDWRLEYVSPDGLRSDGTDVLLSAADTEADATDAANTADTANTANAAGRAGDAGATGRSILAKNVQRPWFVADRVGEYVAHVTVSDCDPFGEALSGSASVRVRVVEPEAVAASEAACIKCHKAQANPVGNMSCQWCHGPAGPHLAAKGDREKRETMEVSYDSGLCGQCHTEYSEWEKSRHSDGYPFGYHEIARPLLLNCAKCHYPEGFAEATDRASKQGTSFGEVQFKRPMFPGGPLFFDFSQLPPEQGEGIACLSCHNPHPGDGAGARSAGLRVNESELCGTCHEEKWQIVLLNGTAGQVGSAFEYQGTDYRVANPHDTEEKCVLCHMNDAEVDAAATDSAGVAELGGHTMRMRSKAVAESGKRAGTGAGAGGGDALNLEPCRTCHPDADTFDINGRQSEIRALCEELGSLLRAQNNGVLPGYRPGDKCATCHRGGTLPFDDDPRLVLENAYTNYKLVMNDRSWGVHNYEYTKRLLEDSIESVRSINPGQ